MLFGVIGAAAADKRLEKGAFGVKAGWIAATDFYHDRIQQTTPPRSGCMLVFSTTYRSPTT